MRIKKMTTVTASGTPTHIVVLPAKRASKVTAKQPINTATENTQRAQKNKLAKPLRGGSLVCTFCPAAQDTSIDTTYDECNRPENSIAIATQKVNVAKKLLI